MKVDLQAEFNEFKNKYRLFLVINELRALIELKAAEIETALAECKLAAISTVSKLKGPFIDTGLKQRIQEDLKDFNLAEGENGEALDILAQVVCRLSEALDRATAQRFFAKRLKIGMLVRLDSHTLYEIAALEERGVRFRRAGSTELTYFQSPLNITEILTNEELEAWKQDQALKDREKKLQELLRLKKELGLQDDD